jgi:chromosome segregation ATPase
MSKVTLDVELRTQMKNLEDIRSKPELKMTKKQQEAYEHNKRGAETALATGDLKAFRNYFNNMTEILKKASVASGQISKNLQELTKRQEDINKDIQALKEKRDELKKSITSSKGEGTLSKEKANELLGDFKDKGKILGKTGNQLNDASIINSRVQKLAQDLQAAGKT